MRISFKSIIIIFITTASFYSCSSKKGINDVVQYATAVNNLPAPPEGKKWKAISHLSDEFNGNTLDTHKWMPRHPFWSGRNSKFTESNVSVANGNLQLKSTLISKEAEVTANTITSACVASNTQRSDFGYYESRIKGSDLSMTSAFWFQGQYSEIDLIENTGKPSNPESKWIENTMMVNTHYFKDGWKKDIETPLKWVMPTSSSSEYHVYGVWWKDATTIWIYHDGIKVGELKTGGNFDEKQFMFFDTEVFTWHGWPTKESLLDPSKNTMLVDWVRGWELVNAN